MVSETQNTNEQNLRLLAAQIEKVTLENQKLRIELDSLQVRNRWGDITLRYIPLLTVLVTVAGFGFGIYQYRTQQSENRTAQAEQSKKDREAREAQAARDTETAQREFMKPLLQKQLSLYFEAAEAAATISNTTDISERNKAINTFWRLYQGPLIVVESKKVSGAMKAFGNCLSGGENCDKNTLNERSRALASGIQESILASWKANPEDFSEDKFHYR